MENKTLGMRGEKRDVLRGIQRLKEKYGSYITMSDLIDKMEEEQDGVKKSSKF